MGRIFNGTALDSRDLPYVALIYGLRIKDPWISDSVEEAQIYCTGIIISPRFVLT